MIPNLKNKPIVFIIDDDVEHCQSLKWLLESVGLTVIVFNNGADFLAAFTPTQLGCILLDIRMPQMSGIELQSQLKARDNTLPIIFMTGHGDIPMTVRAMKEGAFDFLTKPLNEQTVVDQIQRAIAYHRENLASTLEKNAAQERFKTLTKREMDILHLIVGGKLNKEIAYDLEISIKTVELHRTRVMQKMNASTAADLVKQYLFVDKISKTEISSS